LNLFSLNIKKLWDWKKYEEFEKKEKRKWLKLNDKC
jgi:hypothetical protein